MRSFEGAIDFDEEGMVQPHEKVLLTNDISDSLVGDELLEKHLHSIDSSTIYMFDFVHLRKSTLS